MPGMCACCGDLPQEHRMVDAVVDRFLAGESVRVLAKDYSQSVWWVEEIIRSEFRRRIKRQSVKAFWKEWSKKGG